jgi:glycosyltransferase involved in cell wall biosynthesis
MNNQITPGIFVKMIGKEKFDLIHVHSHLHFNSNLAILSNKIKRNPIILTSHGTVTYSGYKELVNILYNKTIVKIVLNSSNKIIALTPSQAKILIKLGADPNKLSIIPNGLDLNKFQIADNMENFNIKYRAFGKKLILYVGSLIPRKGLYYLIKAMSYVKSDANLLIVGDSIQGSHHYKDIVKRLVFEEKLKNIIFLGRLSNQELSKLYNNVDLFILPSLSEGLPLTLLEAMAYRKCVLATNIPGNLDVIKNNQNGMLFNAGDFLDLAKKIDYLLDNHELRKQLGNEARRDVEENYEWNKVLNKILDVYEESVEKSL